MSCEYENQSFWEEPRPRCKVPENGVKSVMFIPWPEGETEAQTLARIDPLLQVGDIMTEPGEKIDFGNDITYHKLSKGQPPQEDNLNQKP